MEFRDANWSFSKAIKAVKAGKDVILTERGKPIAIITPLNQRKNMEPALRRLEAIADAGLALPGAHQRQTDFGHDP